jgi:hypothetical protein
MVCLKKTSLVMVLFLGIGLAGCFEEKQEGGSTPATSGELTDAQKLEQWKLGDWLHDIDAAKRVMEAARKGDFGTPNQDLAVKLDPARHATNIYHTVVRECFAEKPEGFDNRFFDTAHTDHACLDAKGYKRSQ